MEVKINREIREYTENIFFGLSLRQFIFSLCAVGTTVILYYISHKYFGKETLSWVCILGAMPFAAFGFFKYNGMPLEKFIIAFIKTEILMSRELKFKSENIYYEALRPYLEKKKKEELNKNDKNINKLKKTRKE